MKFLVFSLVFLGLTVGCAQAKDTTYGSPTPLEASGTGYRNDKGIPYTGGGDTRLPKAVETEKQEEAKVGKVPTPVKSGKRLRERLIAYSLVRTDSDSKDIKRFGKNQFKISVFVRDDHHGFYELKFAGDFSGGTSELTVGPVTAENDKTYTLTGTLTDVEEKDKVTGEFQLTNSKSGETAKVLYRAYKAKINVRTDSSKEGAAATEKLSASIALLKTDTFAWVNNWVTVNGPSFYSADIVHIVHTQKADDNLSPLLSFSGAALETGEDADPEHPAKVAKNDGGITDVNMIGDAGDEGNRLFEVKLQDKAGKDKTSVLVEMEEENPEPKITDKVPEYTGETVDEAIPNDNSTTEPPAKTTTPARAVPGGLRGVTAQSFLAIDVSSSDEEKMIHDYEANWNFAPVQTWIKSYTTSGSGWRTQMANFFYYAKPFKSIIEAVAQSYQSPATYSYLTMMESSYFKGKSRTHGEYYPGEKSSASAVGIFQILADTAREVGLRVDSKVDERKYFASSSCGAARYIRNLTDQLDGKDATLAILGYNQGLGNVNKQLDKAKRLANSYNYTYRDMARFNAVVSKVGRNYVNQFLAVYFIAGSPLDYGFSMEGRSDLPHNNSIIPASGIQSDTCGQTIQSLNLNLR